jgi:ribosomal protein S18 acetylase RimI-like enzyme
MAAAPEMFMRRLTTDDAAAAARLHREAGALIPGYDTSLHTPEEDLEFHRDNVIPNCDVWGGFAAGRLLGFIAILPGWIDHLYVQPDLHRRGIGSALLRFAQGRQNELRLYTFQSNINARAFYESHGFVIEELTDGARNDEKMPDITYWWSAAG